MWEFTYDGTSHLLTEVEDPLDHDTTFAYGSHKRLTSITHPDANEWELTALQTIGLPTGSSGNELISTNPLGHTRGQDSFKKSSAERGRDGHCWPPPAQIRTSGTTAYGSSFGKERSRRCRLYAP